MEKGEFLLLKYAGNIDPIFSTLISTPSTLRNEKCLSPNLIIKHIDNFYYLTDFTKTSLVIGYMIFDNVALDISWFEIYRPFRNKGYASDIIKYTGAKTVSECRKEDEGFWKKLGLTIK